MRKVLAILAACLVISLIPAGCVVETPPLTLTPSEEEQSTVEPAEQQTYTLSISIFPPGTGSVFPPSGKCAPGIQVILAATPTSGYTFDYWEGDASGSSPTTTITMDSNKNVTAHFKVAEPEPEPVEFSGQGDDVSPKFTLTKGTTIFTMTHDGHSNFAIKLLDNTGDSVGLLVNEIGVFDGSEAIGVREGNLTGAQPGIHLLNITADGNWTVLIKQPRPTSVESLPLNLTGKGCDVSPFIWLNEGLTVFNMTHDGDSNFIITLLSIDGKVAELLVNEIGSYSGKKAIGVKQGNIIGASPGIHILSITADGNWAISVSQ